MDDQQRISLVRQIVDSGGDFDANYSGPNRDWFVEKVIRGLEADGVPEGSIENKVQEFLTKATNIVKTNRDFSLSLSANGNARYTKRLLKDMQRHRVEILYGAIASDRQFVDPSNLKYLLFIARRRFRSICRMHVWVNPNKQGYFRYPERCETDQHWRVNADAQDFWEELSPLWYPNYSPWKLKSSGIADPVKAIESLFARKRLACEGNLFDCETTMSIVFLDSLREARNEDQFIKKLACTGIEYLLIHGFVTDHHVNDFVSDTSENALMRKVGRAAKDLQVGDQCYIINHPLYKAFRPTGSWTGEYSLVYATGNRDYRSERGFVFGGHGKQGRLYKFYGDFITELQSCMAFVRQLAVIHLAFMREGSSAIAPGTVVEEEHDISISGSVRVTCRLIEYKKVIATKDFAAVPTKANPKPKKSVPGFVIIQSKTEESFYLEQVENPRSRKPLSDNIKKKIAEVFPPGDLKHPIKFRRLTTSPPGATPAVIYARNEWGIAYLDPTTDTEELWPFFESVGGEWQAKELKHDDLFKSPFTLFLPTSNDLAVVQPQVNFGLLHQTFLSANGGT